MVIGAAVVNVAGRMADKISSAGFADVSLSIQNES